MPAITTITAIPHRRGRIVASASAASRYRPSERAMPATLPAIEYEAGDAVRKVRHGGWISYGGREWRIGKAMRGLPVAIRQTQTPTRMAVYFCRFRIAELDCGTGSVRRERA